MPKFQAKHYRMLAEIFAKTRDECGPDWAKIRSAFHEMLQEDSAKFDAGLFIDACYGGKS